MFCISTNQCDPVGTNVFLVERDDAFIELLLNYLYKFCDLAARKLEPKRYEDVFGLKTKSKESALKSGCIHLFQTRY